jgi:hypothetical protein
VLCHSLAGKKWNFKVYVTEKYISAMGDDTLGNETSAPEIFILLISFNLSVLRFTERRGQITSTSYSGGPEFKSRPVTVFLADCLMLPSVPPGKCRGSNIS